MSLSQYFGMNSHPLPPVIEPGRTGNVMRYCYEQRVVKPMKHAPVVITLAQRNEERHDKNRAKILQMIAAGVKHANHLADISELSVGTIWNHLKPLEQEGLITINRAVKPWPIKLTRKGRK